MPRARIQRGCVPASPARKGRRVLAGLGTALAVIAVLGAGGCTNHGPGPAKHSPEGALTATRLWSRLALLDRATSKLEYVVRVKNGTDHAVDPILVATLHEKSPAPDRDTVTLPRLDAGEQLDVASSVFEVHRPAPKVTFRVTPAQTPRKLSRLRARDVKLEPVPDERLGNLGAQFGHGVFIIHGRISNTTRATIATPAVRQQVVLHDDSGKIIAAGGWYPTHHPHHVPPDGDYKAEEHYILPSGDVARVTLTAWG